MKKIILAAFVAVASLTANAQVWVGGELGLGTSKTTVNGNEAAKSNYALIVPEVGYKINDNWDVAVKIGYRHTDVKGGASTNSFELAPYARYTFVKSGDFTAFLDGGFSYSNINTKPNKTNDWKIFITPGISYAISEKVGLVAHVGELAYSFTKQGDVKTNAFGLDLDSEIFSFGAYVNF